MPVQDRAGFAPRESDARSRGQLGRPDTIGAAIFLSMDSELRRTRLYRAHEQAELSLAIADPRAVFEALADRALLEARGFASGRIQ